LGAINFEPGDVYTFEDGLHGFESYEEFLAFSRPEFEPFCFLQSTRQNSLRFICLPSSVLAPDLSVVVGAEESARLEIPPGTYCAGQDGLRLLLILTIPARGVATANLLAPVVLAPSSRRGCQCIQFGSGRSAAEPVPWLFQPLSPEAA
jgi:flagellar assembly factor FliW